jgi:GMP reductase
MAGKIFAMCPESAAEIISENGDYPKKVYYGMASRKAQNEWKGGLKVGTCSEGKTVYLNLGEPAEGLLERYSGALRSGITYAGGTDINSFQKEVEFVRFR